MTHASRLGGLTLSLFLHAGAIAGEVTASEAEPEQLGLWMAGIQDRAPDTEPAADQGADV